MAQNNTPNSYNRMTHMKKIIIGMNIALATAASAAVNPEMLVGYDFDDGTNAATLNPLASSIHSDVSASAFGTGVGLSAPAATQTGSGSQDAQNYDFGTANNHNFGHFRDEFGANSSTLANAITANDYMTFTLTLDSGKSFDLTSFTFLSYAGSGGSGTRSSNEWALYSDVAEIGTFEAVTGGIGTTPTTKVWTDNVVNLGNEFNNVIAATTFRLYIYGGTGGNSASQSFFDKVVLNGVAVPEPGTYALLAGCFSLASVMVRRRR